MRFYPEELAKKKTDEVNLNNTDKITRIVALMVAFVSTYFFFFKILFF